MQALGLAIVAFLAAPAEREAELKAQHAARARAALVAQRNAAAAGRAYMPRPPVVNVVYGTIDPNVNGGGAPVGAYADPDTNTIYVPEDPNPYARAHETAHLFDKQVLTEGDRRFFARLMRAPKGPWNHGEAYGHVQGEISPNEWFADYYAASATRQTPARGYAGSHFAEIDARRMRQFEKAMQRLMKRRGLKPYE